MINLVVCVCVCVRHVQFKNKCFWSLSPLSLKCVKNILKSLIMLVLSIGRNNGKVFHFRIQRSLIGAYFVSDKISFATLEELIRYYQNNSRSLGVHLDEPCAQQVGVCVYQPTLSHTYTLWIPFTIQLFCGW